MTEGMIQIVNLCLTGLLAMYVICKQKQYGDTKAGVLGTGFFSIAFYLDSIFYLILKNAAGNSAMFPLMGILISKSIAVIGMAAWMAIRNTDQPETRQSSGESQYLDGLTTGISLFFVVLALECIGSRRDDFSAALRLFFQLLLLAGYYISLFFYREKMRHRERMAEIASQRDKANLYLGNVEEQYQRTRELWHDLKNHISLLSLLLQEGKYGEMADYLRIFGDDIDSLTLPVKSGNLVVDALLADKTAKAKRADIAVTLSLCDLTGLLLQPDEICSLLGNLLDNALEANRQVPEGKFLSVECRERTDCYYIKVRNAAAELEEMQTSRKTDRRNQVGHGLGLRSVERIVHACGGTMAAERGEGHFTAVVRLPRAVHQK